MSYEAIAEKEVLKEPTVSKIVKTWKSQRVREYPDELDTADPPMLAEQSKADVAVLHPKTVSGIRTCRLEGHFCWEISHLYNITEAIIGQVLSQFPVATALPTAASPRITDAASETTLEIAPPRKNTLSGPAGVASLPDHSPVQAQSTVVNAHSPGTVSPHSQPTEAASAPAFEPALHCQSTRPILQPQHDPERPPFVYGKFDQDMIRRILQHRANGDSYDTITRIEQLPKYLPTNVISMWKSERLLKFPDELDTLDEPLPPTPVDLSALLPATCARIRHRRQEGFFCWEIAALSSVPVTVVKQVLSVVPRPTMARTADYEARRNPKTENSLGVSTFLDAHQEPQGCHSRMGLSPTVTPFRNQESEALPDNSQSPLSITSFILSEGTPRPKDKHDSDPARLSPRPTPISFSTPRKPQQMESRRWRTELPQAPHHGPEPITLDTQHDVNSGQLMAPFDTPSIPSSVAEEMLSASAQAAMQPKERSEISPTYYKFPPHRFISETGSARSQSSDPSFAYGAAEYSDLTLVPSTFRPHLDLSKLDSHLSDGDKKAILEIDWSEIEKNGCNTYP